MLIVISDIHFTDGTVGEHNLRYSEVESVFLSDVATLAKVNKAKEVKILLLGDIMDVLRSTQWFDLDPADRPWGANGLSDVPTPKPKSCTERKALDETFDEVVRELLDIELVQQWRSPETHVDEGLRALSSRWLKWIPKRLVDRLDAEDILPLFIGMPGHSRDPNRDPYTIGAYNERVWRANRKIRYILYGHTHTPLQRPLDVLDEREILYINSGTWRPRMVKTVGLDEAPDFIGLKQMTYSIFYREDEDMDNKKPGTVSFDVWTGTKKKTDA